MTNRLFSSLCLLIAVLLGLILSGCKPDPNVAFIQGIWYYNDPHIQEVVGESFQETTWTFLRGAYQLYSCCFVEQEQRGGYQVIESQGDKIVLELFNPGKFNAERTSIQIRIDRVNDTVTIQGNGPFTRGRP